MSQFRIKKIDQALPDEWVPRLNNEGIQLGDDIDARDPNELSEAIFDTQELLLKVSTLSPNQILKTTSGLAERLTLLEQIAGNATLQDVYSNGNAISIETGKPFIVGSGEVFKIDESNSITLNPNVFRIKGIGGSYLDISNTQLRTILGNLTIESATSGSELSLRSSGSIFLKDSNLSSPLSLSETGQGALDTNSQSIVGAINELKNSNFNSTFQSIYEQSAPPVINADSTIGSLVIQDQSGSPIFSPLRVVGNFTATQRINGGSLSIGSSLVYDNTGLNTSLRIKTPVLNTTNIDSENNELTLKDRRISLSLSEAPHTSLSTSAQSLVGAINELYSSVQNAGNIGSIFNQEHDISTGYHKIITTKASVGQNAINRIIIKDASDNNTFTVNGSGRVEAKSFILDGENVQALLSLLNAHMNGDGTDHAALSGHLSATNPHNTVNTLNGLRGNVSIGSLDGSIGVTLSGNTIDLKSSVSTTWQGLFDSSPIKGLNIAGTEFRFFTGSNIFKIDNNGLEISRPISLVGFSNKISGDNLEIENTSGTLNIKSSEDIKIEIDDISGHSIEIGGTRFNSFSGESLSVAAGGSVVDSINALISEPNSQIGNFFRTYLDSNQFAFINNEDLFTPIPNIPEYAKYFFGESFIRNMSRPFYVSSGASIFELFTIKEYGEVEFSTEDDLVDSAPGDLVYSAKRGFIDFGINPSLLSNGITFSLDREVYDFDPLEGTPLDTCVISGTTGVPDYNNGIFQIVTGGVANLRDEQNTLNIINALNNLSWKIDSGIQLVAIPSGEKSSGGFVLNSNISEGDSFVINFGSASVTFESIGRSDIPSTYYQFNIGIGKSSTAENLAEVINKTSLFRNELKTLVGHKLKAKAINGEILLESIIPGTSSNNTTLASSNTTDVDIFSMSGGTNRIRIFKQSFKENIFSLTSSNPSSIVDLISKEDEVRTQLIIDKEDPIKEGRLIEHNFPVLLGRIKGRTNGIISLNLRQ